MIEKKFLIELLNVTKTYKSSDMATEVLHGISFNVKEGEFIAIMGPSGSGKSTLLHIIGLLDIASTGLYNLKGFDVTKLTEDSRAYLRNKEIGFVFQSFNLLSRVNVLENVVLPAIYKGVKKPAREKIAKTLLEQLGLLSHITKKPNQLSGGQQQRVAIARALMNNPALILADEPTGNLDTKSGQDVMQILTQLNKDGRTVIMITHEKDIASNAKRIISIRDGKLVS